MKLTALLCTLLFATASIVYTQENSEAAIRSKIAALEKGWNQAYKARDVRALDRILDDGIVLINDDGTTQTKAEFLADVKSVKNFQQQQIAPESLTVRVLGNLAIASGVFQAKGVADGKSYIRRERFVDTWIERAGNWVCVASSATPVAAK
jgi:ketosteroid isomerase-like protein